MNRILCIISALTAGGAETFLMKVYRALPPDQFQFDFVVSVEGGCYTDEVLSRGGRIHSIPLRTKDPAGAFTGIRNIVKENNYNYVLKLGETPIAVFDLIAAKLGGAKCLAMRSCNALTGQSFKARCTDTLLRPILNAVANVKLAPSALAAEFTFGKRRARRDVHILHNGVDLTFFRYDEEGRQRIREELSLADRFVVGHIGRFHEQKNHPFLLKVFQQIRQQRQDAVLLLVGTGKLESRIRAQAKELGIEDAVIFAGQRFDVPQILSAMDVFVFPSLHEGMPNTVIEAQATGLPCVIADTITPEADITGLVTYVSLEETPECWAEIAQKQAAGIRRNTAPDFLAHGYDIERVAKELMDLLLNQTGIQEKRHAAYCEKNQ